MTGNEYTPDELTEQLDLLDEYAATHPDMSTGPQDVGPFFVGGECDGGHCGRCDEDCGR